MEIEMVLLFFGINLPIFRKGPPMWRMPQVLLDVFLPEQVPYAAFPFSLTLMKDQGFPPPVRPSAVVPSLSI